MTTIKNIDDLVRENAELRSQLSEANNIIDAIKDGGVDALVLDKDGQLGVYSIESADYTYRVLIEKSGEGALSIAEDDLIVYCNECFAGMIGVPTKQLIGTYLNSYIESVGDFQKLRASMKNGTSKGEIVLNCHGKKLPVYVSLTDLNPAVPAIGIIVTDLTEQRTHEEALAVYQRKLEVKLNELNLINSNLEEFIHVLSHDIKEPVRKILLFSGSLLTTAGPALLHKTELKRLNSINASARRLNSLVDDMVKYSLSTAKTETSEVNLNQTLKEVVDDLSVVIKESHTTIQNKKLPVVDGSPIQLRRLFSNLVTNSIKYKQPGKQPVVDIQSEIRDCIDPHFPNKKFNAITFRDNGIGMEPNELNKIFVMFQRLHMPNEYSGNGIGLAICKKIMENHLGKIEVESMPGEGSTFKLYLPIKN